MNTEFLDSVYNYFVEKNEDYILEIIKTNLINFKTLIKNGFTAFQLAIIHQLDNIVKTLLELDPDHEYLNKYNSDLHFAATNGTYETVRLLLKFDFDPNLKDLEGRIPLHYAVREGKYEISKLLIDSGSDVNSIDDFDCTPLHLACHEGKLRVSKLLIDSGADISVTNGLGFTPLHLAAMSPENTDLVRFLIHSGSDPNAFSKLNSTPLDESNLHNNLEISRILIKAMEN